MKCSKIDISYFYLYKEPRKIWTWHVAPLTGRVDTSYFGNFLISTRSNKLTKYGDITVIFRGYFKLLQYLWVKCPISNSPYTNFRQLVLCRVQVLGFADCWPSRKKTEEKDACRLKIPLYSGCGFIQVFLQKICFFLRQNLWILGLCLINFPKSDWLEIFTGVRTGWDEPTYNFSCQKIILDRRYKVFTTTRIFCLKLV